MIHTNLVVTGDQCTIATCRIKTEYFSQLMVAFDVIVTGADVMYICIEC